MLSLPLFMIGYAFLAFIIYQICSLILHKRHNINESKRRGCLPPPRAPDKGLWGINLLKESMKATKDGWGPQWMHQNLNSLGPNVHTASAPVFDYELLITRDIENCKALFNTQSADFDIGPHRERTFKSAIGLGVMTSRGEAWKYHRALVRPQFARGNIANLPMFEKHVQILFKRMQHAGDSWTAKMDMQPMFQSFTLDTGTEFLVGQSVYSQDPEERARMPMSWDPNGPDVAGFGHHLDEVKRILDRKGAMAKYSWLFRDNDFSTHVKALHNFVDYFVAKKLNQSDEEKKIETSTDMSEKYVLLDELFKETQDPIELRSETLNILHASRDTTAALIGWTIYFISRHEDVFNKLRAEISASFGNSAPKEFNELWKCSYMVSVINETVRYVGVVPMNERAAIRDTTLPRGGGPDGQSPVFVPKGRQILIPTYSMQHRPDIWGPDVDEYKPERWEGRKFGWDFIPFGGGPRQCLGQQFAKTETMYLLVRMLQRFDKIENMEAPGTPMSFHHTIENRSGTGVQVRLHFADANETNEKQGLSDFEPGRNDKVHI